MEWAKSLAWGFVAAAASDVDKLWVGIVVALVTYAAIIIMRVRAHGFDVFTKLKHVALLSDMASIAKQLTENVVSPAFIVQRLLQTSGKGAV